MVNPVLVRPAHCELPGCERTNIYPNGRARTDIGTLWLCGTHQARWTRHRSFTLPPRSRPAGPKPHSCEWPGCENERLRQPCRFLTARCAKHRYRQRRRTHGTV